MALLALGKSLAAKTLSAPAKAFSAAAKAADEKARAAGYVDAADQLRHQEADARLRASQEANAAADAARAAAWSNRGTQTATITAGATPSDAEQPRAYMPTSQTGSVYVQERERQTIPEEYLADWRRGCATQPNDDRQAWTFRGRSYAWTTQEACKYIRAIAQAEGDADMRRVNRVNEAIANGETLPLPGADTPPPPTKAAASGFPWWIVTLVLFGA